MKRLPKLENLLLKFVVNRENSPLRYLYDIVTVFADRQILTYSASWSYYLMFTIFPLLILLSAILSMLHLNPDVVFQYLTELLPGAVAELIRDYISYAETNQSLALVLVALTLIFTSASAAFRTLMNASNRIYQKETFPSWLQVVVSVAMCVALIVLIYLSFVVLLTGSWFFRMIKNLLGITIQLFNWNWLRFLILFCLLFLFLSGFYRLSSPKEKPRPRVMPGAIGASVALVVVSIVFSYFIALSSKYSLVYGSLASVILLLLWMYLMGIVVLLGAVFNYVLYRHAQFRQDGIPIDDIVENRLNRISRPRHLKRNRRRKKGK